jgi:nucleoside-diphosphate-sugar epimerase
LGETSEVFILDKWQVIRAPRWLFDLLVDMSNNKKIFITGGSGFIGYYLQQCVDRETTIYSLAEPEFRHSASYVKGDVRDPEAQTKVLNGHDIVFHLAAKHEDFGISRSEYMDTNEGGAKALVQAADKVGIKGIVFFSSVGVYGDRKSEISRLRKATPCQGGRRSEVRGQRSEIRGQRSEITTEDTPLEPTNPYGESKLAAERVFLNWANKRPDRCLIIIRPTVVFGPRNRANMYNLIDQIAKGRYINIGNGSNIKSVAYVENLVEASLFLLNKLSTGAHIYNYADYPHFTTGELTRIIFDALGKRPSRLKIPLSAALLIGQPFDLAIRLTGKNLPISTARIKKFCTTTHHKADKILREGFRPRFTIEEGLHKMVKWYISLR